MVPTRRRDVLRQAASAAAAFALLLAGAAAQAAAAQASIWDLVLDGGQNQCRLTLRGGGDAPVAMPPGCRHAFASLKGVTRWSETGEGRLQFDDARGEPLLVFDADGDGFRTTSPQGEQLLLKPASPGSRASLAKAAETASPPAVVAEVAAKPAATRKPAPAATPKPAEVAGRYAVMRDRTRDTGCMVTLDDHAHGPGNTLKARLAPACRDQGIVIFDPVGWEMARGQMVLTARKGHTTALDPQDDGTWMNSPKAGKSLGLKRI